MNIIDYYLYLVYMPKVKIGEDCKEDKECINNNCINGKCSRKQRHKKEKPNISVKSKSKSPFSIDNSKTIKHNPSNENMKNTSKNLRQKPISRHLFQVESMY